MAKPSQTPEPIVFDPMVITARPEVTEMAQVLAGLTPEEREQVLQRPLALTPEEQARLTQMAAQQLIEKRRKDLSAELNKELVPAAMQAAKANIAPEVLSRLVGGAFSGLTETVADYAQQLVPGLNIMQMADPLSSEARAASEQPRRQTAGEEFRETVIKPRLKQTVGERMAAPLTDVIVAVPAFYKVFTEGTPKQQAELAEQIGRALTRGTIGNIEQFLRRPTETIAAMPSETLFMLFPVLRAFGAAAKLGTGTGKVSKAVRFAGEVLDPTPTPKVYKQVPDDALATRMANLTPDQIAEYNRLGKLDPTAAAKFIEDVAPVAPRIVEVGEKPQIATRIGRGARRALGGGVVGAAVFGDPLAAMFSAAGVALTPEIASALTTLARQYNINITNVGRQYLTDLKRQVIDPAAVGTPAETQAVREVMEKGAMGEAVAARGRAAAAAAEQAGPAAVARAEEVAPLKAARQRLELSDVGFTEPVQTMQRRQAALAAEQAAKAGAPAAELAAGVYAQRAKDLIEAVSGGSPKVQRSLQRSVALQERITQILPTLGEKGKRYAKQIAEIEQKRPDLAQAYRIAKLKDEAVTVYLQTRYFANMAKKLDDKVAKASPQVQLLFRLQQQAKPFGASVYAKGNKQYQKFFNRYPQYAQHTYDSLVSQLSKKDAQRLRGLQKTRAAVDKKIAALKGSKAGVAVEEAIGDAIELKNLQTALRKEAAALRKDAGEDAFRRLQGVNKRLAETLEAEAKLKARLAKNKIALDENAPGLLDIVATMRGESLAAKRLKMAVAKSAKSEKQLRLKAGQDVPEMFAERLPGQGGVIKNIAVVSKDPTVRAFHKSISDIYKRINPTHALANPEYLNQLVAHAWSKNALIGAFSARVRGAFSKQLYTDLLNSNPAGLKAFIDQALKDSPDLLKQARAAAGDAPLVGKTRPAQAISKRAREQVFREAIEKMVVDRMSKPIAAGQPVNLQFVLPTGPNTPPIVVSPARVAAELFEAGTKNKEYKGILREAMDGLHGTLAHNLQTDVIHGELAAEALRGANRLPSAGQELNAFATVRAMKTQADKPSILLFNPKDVLEQLPPPGTEIPVELAKTLRAQNLSLEEVRQALTRLAATTEEAAPIIAQGVRSGLGNRNKATFGSFPIFVSKGYNDSIGTHLRAVNNAFEARTILGWLGEGLAAGTTRLLVGTTATKVSNALSNITVLATAMGTNPASIFGGSVQQYLRLMAAQRGGALKMPGLPEIKLSPYQSRKIEAMQNARIVNSAMFGPEMERLFKAKDPSQGRLSSGWRAYWNLRKEAYKAVDAAPKMYVTDKSFDTLYGVLDRLEPGRSVSMPLGKGTYMRVTKTADNQLLWGTGKKRVALDSQEAANLIADSARLFANNTLFDMNDMPNFAKKVMSSKLGLTGSVFNRYMSWQIKAMELPGKKGLFRSALDYDPLNHIITDSPTINKDKIKASLKLLAKRQGLIAGARALAEPYNNPGLSQDTGWSAASDIAAWNPMGDTGPATGGKMTLTQASASIVADQALRLVESAGAKAMEMFGYTTSSAKRDRQSDDPLDQMRSRLYRNLKAGELANPATLAEYFGLTGGILAKTFERLKRGDVKSSAQLRDFATRLWLGGDISTTIDGALSQIDPSMSTRRLIGTQDDKRPEDALQWWLAKMFRFGFREEDLNDSNWVKHRKSDVTRAIESGFKTNMLTYQNDIRNLKKQPQSPDRDAAIAKLREKLRETRADLIQAERLVDFVSDSFERDFIDARKRYQKMKKRYSKTK